MRLMRRLALPFAALAVLVFASGCGETVIDATKTEEALEANLSKSLNGKVAAVDCPSDVEVKKGNTFNCSVNMQKGQDQTVTLKILNEDADVNVTDIRASNE